MLTDDSVSSRRSFSTQHFPLTFSYLTIILIVSITLLLQATDSYPQTKWYKYPFNPVLSPGLKDTWDNVGVYWPLVIYDGTTYHMFYAGWGKVSNEEIGYAYSQDGMIWQKSEFNPVLKTVSGEWDYPYLAPVGVIYDGEKYHLWYSSGRSGNIGVGYASSVWEPYLWIKHSTNPVFKSDEAISGLDLLYFSPTIAFDGKTYHMWYGRIKEHKIYGFGYASSKDGINWEKYGNDPVFTPGPPGSYDIDIYWPHVLYHREVFHMWYRSIDYQTNMHICYATSHDGINWERHPENPCISMGRGDSWDAYSIQKASVIIDDETETYKMWYGGISRDIRYQIGYATSPFDFETSINNSDDKSDSDDFSLYQNYPNPANPMTTIQYELPRESWVELTVTDMLGRKIASLVSEIKPSGHHQVTWNGLDDAGNRVASGVYLYRMTSEGNTETRKLLLIR